MMETNLNDLFLQIRERVIYLIDLKDVDVDILSFELGISRDSFISNFSKKIDDFSFYLQTLSLLEHWEG